MICFGIEKGGELKEVIGLARSSRGGKTLRGRDESGEDDADMSASPAKRPKLTQSAPASNRGGRGRGRGRGKGH